MYSVFDNDIMMTSKRRAVLSLTFIEKIINIVA